MSSSVKMKQTRISFSERKLRPRSSSIKYLSEGSSDENSPVKNKEVKNEKKRIPRRCLSELQLKSEVTTPRRASKRNKGKSPDYKEIEVDTPTPTKRKCQSLKKLNNANEDSSDEVVSKTPSSAFSKLALESPIVEKRGLLKPQELFPIFSSARKAFHGAGANSLPCREKEVKELSDFLKKHLKEKKCGSLYVSGLPGTGKTASLNFVIQQDEIAKGYQIAKINCTSISSSANVYRRICEELNIEVINKTEKESIAAIENFLLRKHKMILLILDEIDQLETKTQSVLYKIFEWPSWGNARLVLVGIANAMDLTDRLLPRLCAKVELKPILMHFAPYSKEQITKILSQRLSEVGAEGVFAPSAIEMISAKVATMSGDIRRALDLGRRVMEMSEEKKKATVIAAETTPMKKVQPLTSSARKSLGPTLDLEAEKLSRKLTFDTEEESKETAKSPRKSPRKSSNRFDLSPRKSPRKMDLNKLPEAEPKEITNTPRKSPRKSITRFDLTPRKSPRKIDFTVDTKDVFNVVKNIYGSSKNFKATEDCFPLHQKLLICTFLLASKKGKSKDLVVAKLHQVYSKICKKRMITPVDLSGFLFLCRQVEMTGVIQMGKGHGKLAKVLLQWDEAEITNAIKDLHLLSSILNDVACLS